MAGERRPIEYLKLYSRIDGILQKMLSEVAYLSLCLCMVCIQREALNSLVLLMKLWVSFHDHTLAGLFTGYCLPAL